MYTGSNFQWEARDAKHRKENARLFYLVICFVDFSYI